MTPEKIKTMSIEKLVELFEMTETVNDENIYTVRGWLMDAIAEKNPEGFDAWLELEAPEDSELRNYVI